MSYDPYGQPAAAPSEYTQAPGDARPATNADRWALIALVVAATTILSCLVPGFSCLAPLAVGIVALTQASKAADPKQARTFSWIAIGIGVVILVGVLVIIGLYGAIIVAAINDAGGLP
jgi:hypothetical protein